MNEPTDKRLQNAVALAYSAGERAPTVVAKGSGLVAEQIIRRAQDAGVFVHESKELVSLLMHVDLDREVLVGATFVGPGVSELIHSASVAVAGEVPVERLWHAVPAYPTISEVWLRLLETYRG